MFLQETSKFRQLLSSSANKFEKMLNVCSAVAKNATTKEKFRQMKITGSIPQIKELLEPDCVQSFILAGKAGCSVFLLPLLAEYFSCMAITPKEKEGKVKQLKDDIKEATRIANEEFDPKVQKLNKEGVAFFNANINTVIEPYKL